MVTTPFTSYTRAGLYTVEVAPPRADAPELQYESLKAYLMLYTPEHLDKPGLQAWVGLDWDANLEGSLGAEKVALRRAIVMAYNTAEEIAARFPDGFVMSAVGTTTSGGGASGLDGLLKTLADDYGLVSDVSTGDVALPAGELRTPRFARIAEGSSAQ